jgi:hypothetical protein
MQEYIFVKLYLRDFNARHTTAHCESSFNEADEAAPWEGTLHEERVTEQTLELLAELLSARQQSYRPKQTLLGTSKPSR